MRYDVRYTAHISVPRTAATSMIIASIRLQGDGTSNRDMLAEPRVRQGLETSQCTAYELDGAHRPEANVDKAGLGKSKLINCECRRSIDGEGFQACAVLECTTADAGDAARNG